MTLENFLAMPDVSELREEVYINERIGRFVIKPMTEKQWGDYRKRCTKTNSKNVDIDYSKLNLLVISNQVVEPNFADAKFLADVGCTTAAEFISRKFRAGEVQDIADKIVRVSGFEADINEDVETAKNS